MPKKTEKGDPGPFGLFDPPFCSKISKKLKGDPLETKIFFRKVSQCRKKLKRGTRGPLGFLTIHSIARYQKNEGRPFGDKKNSKKNLTVPR